MGARPMSRLIQEKLKKPLAEKILFGDLESGGEVEICLNEAGDGVDIHILEEVTA
jgi:ATP-dependent Clp protease ATP-binding subunit ClpA